MVNRTVRLLMLGETLRIKNDQMKCCITRAANGFLVGQNIRNAQRYLQEIQATLDEMNRLEDSRITQKQLKQLQEISA
jgi:hypothetical protein